MEIEQVRRDEADSMFRDTTAKICSKRSTLSSLQSANTALRFEIANLRAERDELVAERKEPSDLQQEHNEEVEALQGTLVRTKKGLEGTRRELRTLESAAASTDSLTEDQSITMSECLTLAYAEVEDIKQLLAQRSDLWDQVDSSKSACHKLDEENKKYFHQRRSEQVSCFVSLLWLALTLLLVKESRFQSSKRRKGPKLQLEPYPKFRRLLRPCRRSAFENDTDDESIASSTSYTSYISPVLTTFSSLITPSPSFTMPSWVPCFDSDCTNLAFEVVSDSALTYAISASVVVPLDEASQKRKFTLDLDDATPKTRRKHEHR
ncbi:hypothetical protein DEU56DRAFT_912493 [Suillus clintonianus]|uniref:uncharacterized protein n=1 Tax=Suillus clintonianus TaxID=1904413 RepID=UPI001B87E4D9|nr:uncharacterized protein DEU56DRAFT_912493 [Suillus clintonianus]KAG2138335.1 hypothetical protein DEU56DRAFT_912493 [Suillus clintonianus]